MAYPVYTESLSFGGSEHGQGQQVLPYQAANGSLKVSLLHGNLAIWVMEAKNLPNMDMLHKTLGDVNSENPVWEQHFDVPVAHYASEVHFVVKDSDVVGSQIIGVGSDPDHQGVPGTYFPLRRGGRVTLYQDAHVHDGCLPNLELDGRVQYEQGNCWQDIFDAISKARRLIYITGWSVYHKVRLVRDKDETTDYMLGDLLKTKSQEGVRVLLLVWDDPTSRSILGYKTEGVMQTYDEETRRFFKHSSVQVLLCPRSAVKGSWVKKQEAGTIYTHHQKTVLVDADAGHSKRKIIAFVGGLDLCMGRYDTPEHSIFRSLKTVHKDDCRNPTFSERAVGCPRQPWHDLHSKIDGPAAYDVLTNFEERWLKASKPHGLQKLKTP
ncbi:phospholipase D beta 1 [Prunus yedoensis var. nudiflora]|uniref:phospholipase D n=1 Tax=Prunus yedoensis var. nudiflora TaxID=2094558 RepID=A0A314Z6E2_PRUYE|nr:phospholipase D beta 1 [Prunus yedoensis var. nudiflora]